MNIQGPNHHDVAQAIFSHLLKTKISKDKLVKLKNQWLKDGVPGSSMGVGGIAEEEDDDNEEKEEDGKYGDSDGGSQMEG